MAKTILECEIEVFQSLSDGNKYIAVIQGFDFVFRGKTPMQAHKIADKWRVERWNEIAKPSERVKATRKKPDLPAQQSPQQTEEVEP